MRTFTLTQVGLHWQTGKELGTMVNVDDWVDVRPASSSEEAPGQELACVFVLLTSSGAKKGGKKYVLIGPNPAEARRWVAALRQAGPQAVREAAVQGERAAQPLSGTAGVGEKAAAAVAAAGDHSRSSTRLSMERADSQASPPAALLSAVHSLSNRCCSSC